MMKKTVALALAALMALSCGALAATVAPMPQEIDAAEGTYAASFDRDQLSDGVITGAMLFTEDCYDIAEVNQLAVGDELVADGETVTVSSLEKDEYGDIIVNGGIDEGGYTLRAFDEDNCWKVVMYDDLTTYTNHGEFTLTLADDVVFTDASDIEKPEPLTASGIEAVAEAIAASDNEYFDSDNTTVRIEGGKVVEINRRYVP